MRVIANFGEFQTADDGARCLRIYNSSVQHVGNSILSGCQFANVSNSSHKFAAFVGFCCQALTLLHPGAVFRDVFEFLSRSIGNFFTKTAALFYHSKLMCACKSTMVVDLGDIFRNGIRNQELLEYFSLILLQH